MAESAQLAGHAPEEIARAYFLWHAEASEKASWVLDLVYGLSLDARWEQLWELILVFCANVRSDNRARDLGLVGAGPLEDLLDGAGPAFIERIEREAASNSNFATALTGVWPSEIEPAVWSRVTAVCRRVPDPIDVPYRY